MEFGYDLFHNKVMNKYKPLYLDIFPRLNQSYGLGMLHRARSWDHYTLSWQSTV